MIKKKKVNFYQLGICILCCLSTSHADSKSLQLSEVLESAKTHHPKIQSAVEKLNVAKGKFLSAQGQFDPNIAAKYSIYGSGYYEGTNSATSEFLVPLETASSDFSLKYRNAGGDFPVYEDEYDTLSDGEVGAELKLSLLKDRAIDQRRAGLKLGSSEIERAENLQNSTEILVSRDAAVAYWGWLMSIGQLKVYQELLAVSERRQDQFDKQVQAGQLAEIVAVDNSRAILKRKDSLLKQEQKVLSSAQKLSLYWRDANGEPLIPKKMLAPTLLPKIITKQAVLERQARETFDRRPDVIALNNEIEQLETKVELAENSLLPKLDFKTSVTRDYGDGKESREGTEWKNQLQFEVPLYRRTAKGKVSSLNAELRSKKQELRLLRDSFDTNFETLRAILDMSTNRDSVLVSEVKVAERLEKAEFKRFEAGASTLLLVAIRELETASVKNRRFSNILENRIAYLELMTLLGDQESIASN